MMPSASLNHNSRSISIPRRSLSIVKHSMLPDIAEVSPVPPSPMRHVRTTRPQSIHSLLSDGTIEVDGFGYLEEEMEQEKQAEEDDSWDTESLAPSLYDSSVYDGYGGENDDGRVTPATLSRRAERVLENAKKKLDLCGQNITRARHSLIMSPPGSALSRYSDPDSAKTESRTVTPSSVVAPHLTLHSSQFRFNSTSHLRTVSESAVPTVGNLARVNSLKGVSQTKVTEPAPARDEEHGRSKSAMQVRALRDQMKDLRGKINNLQQRARSDSLKRRSLTGLRNSPVSYQSRLPLPAGKLDTPAWLEEEEEEDGYAESYTSSRTSTPRPNHRESRHEDREDAFSYDSLFIGNGIYAPRASLQAQQNAIKRRSQSLESFASPTQPELAPRGKSTSPIEKYQKQFHHTHTHTLKRRDSFTSISSYATADDGGAGFRSPSSTGSSASTQRGSPKHRLSPSSDKGADDGYHSAPHTPRTAITKSQSPIQLLRQTYQRPTIITPSSSSTIIAPASTLITPTLVTARRGSKIMSGSDGVEISGNLFGDISIQLPKDDRLLVERLIEELGKTCCAMECATDQVEVARFRRRLEMALTVLEG